MRFGVLNRFLSSRAFSHHFPSSIWAQFDPEMAKLLQVTVLQLGARCPPSSPTPLFPPPTRTSPPLSLLLPLLCNSQGTHGNTQQKPPLHGACPGLQVGPCLVLPALGAVVCTSDTHSHCCLTMPELKSRELWAALATESGVQTVKVVGPE